MLKWLITITIFLITSQAWATVYYVRTDGSTATNCLGTSDAAYDGSGTGEACAFNHPNWALELQGQTAGAMAGGDTLVIKSGTYTIGCLGSGTSCRSATYNITNSATCDTSWPYDCYPNPVPDGTSPTHTKIIGCSTTGCATDADRPILTGQGRATMILNLSNSDYVDVTDIIITDSATCGAAHPTLACGSSDADELTALDGVYLEGASYIAFDTVYIHGLYRYGIYGGNETGTITFTDTKVDFNSFGGWNLDTCSNDGTCGVDSGNTVSFYGSMTGSPSRYSTSISWNGCVEDSSSIGNAATVGCYEQDAGGYGDAIGSSNTSGAWIFDGVDISHNTSDGIDLLYMNVGSQSGGTLVVKNSRIEGNNGNQVKASNQIELLSNMIIGNCGFFYGQTYTNGTFNTCRALGNTIEINFIDDNTVPKIIGNTILGNGDVLIDTAGTCTTGTDITVANNILYGGREFEKDTSIDAGGDNSSISIYYDSSGSCDTDFIDTYNICYSFTEGSSACNGTGSTDTVDPLFSGTIKQGPYTSPGYYTGTDYVNQLTIQSGSSAVNAADETVSGALSTDYNRYARGASWDIGALEYGSVAPGGRSSQTSGTIRLTGALRLQ